MASQSHAYGLQEQACSVRHYFLLVCSKRHSLKVIIWVQEKPVQDSENCFPLPFCSAPVVWEVALCPLRLCLVCLLCGEHLPDLPEHFSQICFRFKRCI